MIFTSVDLPAPLAPTSASISPEKIAKSTSRKAAVPPNVLPTPLTSRRAKAAADPLMMFSDPEVSGLTTLGRFSFLRFFFDGAFYPIQICNTDEGFLKSLVALGLHRRPVGMRRRCVEHPST